MSTFAPPSVAPVLSYGPAANRGDRNFFGIITGGVLLVPLLVFGFLVVLIAGAWPAIHHFGWSFISGKTWDANAEGGALFGALPFIYGTMVTAIGALLVAAPIGVGVATFLSEIETEGLSLPTGVYVTAPIVAFMAPVCTMTDFADSGPMFLAMLLFLIVGAVLLKWLTAETRLVAIIIAALPMLYLAARLVAGEKIARLPLDLVGIALGVVGAMFVLRKARKVMPFLLEVLATIPSVVYGMWGLFVLSPWIADHVQPYAKAHWQPAIDSIFGVTMIHRRAVPNFPLFHYSSFPSGLGMGTAILVLSIMILPVIVSLSLDALRSVPKSYREAALGLGATRWEMIRIAVLPPARSGIFGACILALGRALGETMAVTMVIGNDTRIPYSIFGKGYTISSIIANEYGEADGLKLASLMELALILFVITLGVNLLARLLVRKPMTQKPGIIARVMHRLGGVPLLGFLRFWPYAVWALIFGAAGGFFAWYVSSIRLFFGASHQATLALIWIAALIFAAGGGFLLWALTLDNSSWRRLKNWALIGLMGMLVLICLIPLGALSYALVREGGSSLSGAFLSGLPKPAGEVGGGVGNAILGSFLLLMFAAVFAVPLGMALGIYLTQRSTTKLASFTRLLLDVLSGIPAIIVGVFIYAVVVRKTGVILAGGFWISILKFSLIPGCFAVTAIYGRSAFSAKVVLAAWVCAAISFLAVLGYAIAGWDASLNIGLSTLAGSLALAMIMLPIFARASEEALKSIPRTVDEAGLGLGLPRRTVVLRILIRAAIPAILTGLFLALARVGGEAAPLLFTTQSSSFWPSHDAAALLTLKPLREPVASLPLVIFEYSKSPYADWKAQAWGASLVLVAMVLVIRLSTHAYTAWRFGAKETHV